MTEEERLQYIDVGLRLANIELHKDLLRRVVAIIDLVAEKEGQADIMDVIRITEKFKKL